MQANAGIKAKMAGNYMNSLIDSVDIVKERKKSSPNRSQKLIYKVSFRLDTRLGRLLEDRAKAAGTTPHDVARKLIEEKLNRNDEALLDGLNFLAASVQGIQEAMRHEMEEQIQTLKETLLEELKEVREVNARNLVRLAEAINKKAKG